MQGFFQRYLRLYRPLISLLNEMLNEYDLSYSLWQIILYLKNNGPSMLIEISNYYHVEKPTITRSVQKLQEKGIIEVVPGKDRRGKIIQLTGLGQEIYQICREKITELEYQVMESIPDEEQTATYHILPKIRENIIKRGK